MTIHAKYASRCKSCGGHVPKGTEVEWSPGEGVKHLPGQCAERASSSSSAPREQQPVLPSSEQVPAGRYAVENTDGELRFYRVARSKRSDRVWLHVQHGPSESEVHFSWAGYRAILESIVEAGAREAAVRYGQEIGRCSSCGLRLTNALSRELGIGPVCGGRFYAESSEWTAVKRTAREALRARGIDPDSEVEVPEESAPSERTAAPVSRSDFMRVPAGSSPEELDNKYGEEPPF